jgi:hypothetical protein
MLKKADLYKNVGLQNTRIEVLEFLNFICYLATRIN